MSSEQEDEKISKHECTYVSPTAELNATEEISFKTSTSAVLTGTSPNSEFEKPNILKYDSRSSQTSEFVNTINDQLISAVEKSTSESLLSDQLNRTYVVESNGHSKIRNCDMNHPFVADQTPTDTLHSSSDSILSQNVNRKKKQHICTVEHKSKYSHRSEEKGISTEGYDFLQSQHYPDLLKESVELKNSSGHQSNRVLESFDNKEKYKDSKVLWQDDQASRAPANENTEPLTERRRANEEKIDSVVNKSVMISDCLLDNESELSENVQNIAFIANHHSQDPSNANYVKNGEQSDAEDKDILTVAEDKENFSVSPEVLIKSFQNSYENDTRVCKQNKAVKTGRRHTEADLLDYSFCEWEDDMYSQVKSRTNRQERRLSLHSENLILSQGEMVPYCRSQNNTCTDDDQINTINKILDSSTEVAHNHKAIAHHHGQVSKRKRATFLIKTAFQKMLPEIKCEVSDFLLSENEFGNLLTAKFNLGQEFVHENIPSAASKKCTSLKQEDYCRSVLCLKYEPAIEDRSKESSINSAQTDSEILGSESNVTDTHRSVFVMISCFSYLSCG